MSEDWLVTSARPVDLTDVIAGLAATLPDHSLRADEHDRYVVVVDDDDRPLAWIGIAREVARPAQEAARLGIDLGVVSPDGDAQDDDRDEEGALDEDELRWWTEITGPDPDIVRETAIGVAGGVDGWPTRWSTAPTTGSGSRPDAPGDCPVDVVTAGHGILLCSRPVVALTHWLVEAATWTQANERRLVVITPDTTRLTRAAGSAIARLGATWAVDGGDGLYDGLTGARLTLDGGHFRHGDTHPAYRLAGDEQPALALDAQTLHAYDADITIGAFAQALCAVVDAPAPDRFGLMEPAEADLDLNLLGEAAIALGPEPVRFYLVGSASGGGAVAGGSGAGSDVAHPDGTEITLTVAPGPVGVLEHVALMASRDPDPVDLARGALDAGASRLVAGRRLTAPGRLAPPHPTSPLQPLVVAASLDRYPTLPVDELLALGAEGSSMDEERRAVIVIAPPDIDDAGPAHLRLMTLLDEHDSLT